ncbi:MAG: glutathione S-transferase [Rhizobacter sp.]|nr:glutathione S-transferase [Rhizobacter sp.]
MTPDTPPPYRLYGAEISYFTGKVRAYLRWKGLPFEEVLSDASVYREVIVPRVGFPVIPVVVTPDGDTLQDSTDIIDTLERRHGEPAVYPATPLQRLVALLFEVYGDEWLVIPAMHYRWHHNRDWALREFGALSAPGASPDEQLAIGTRRAAPFAQAAVLLGAEPHMHGAVEASYQAFMAEMDAHFAQHPFLLGTRPSIGDFGLVGPLYAHQLRDPASGALMRAQAPHLVRWVERMQQPPTPCSGEFLPDDDVPATLLPTLRRMMREQLPVLADSARLLRAWVEAHPGEHRVPRVLGSHAFELEGKRGQRIVRPYSLWMLQRARDAYRALEPAQRERANRLLAELGGTPFAEFADPPRLVRDGMSVALA